MYKILHIPTKKHVKKASSVGWTAIILNRCLTGNNPNNYKLEWALTSGAGHSYNTKKGADDFIKMLATSIKDQFIIEEYTLYEVK